MKKYYDIDQETENIIVSIKKQVPRVKLREYQF